MIAFLRRRWLPVLGLLLVLGLSTPPAAYLLVRRQGDRELARVCAELDAADPGWRMPDLFAARDATLRTLPVNSAATSDAVLKLLPAGWDQAITNESWPGDGPSNRGPDSDQLAELKQLLERIGPALEAARPLRDQSAGGSAYKTPDWTKYAVDLPLDAPMGRRQVTGALNQQAAAAAHAGDPARAVDAVRSMLNVSRSLGDEPLLIGQLVRIACGSVAVRAAERVLGLCEPDAGLAELQAGFTREAGEPWMRFGLRGERGSVDQLMTNLRAGPAGPGVGSVSQWAQHSPFLPHDHAAGLRLLTACVEDAGRPPHQRGAAAEAGRQLLATPAYRTQLSRLLVPAVDKVLEADARGKAYLTAAAVGLACERHRRATGRWPDALADIPRSILPEVPADPFDRRPLRYQRTPDGAVVYSVGPNLLDDGGRPPAGGMGGIGGDVVFRLFDPDRRRLPPLPPAPVPEP